MTPRTSGILTGAGESEFFTEESVVGVAPAGATKARVEVYGYCTGASPRVRMALPTMAILPPGQLVAPALSRGFDAEPGADPTAGNISGGFDGQGALASENSVTTGLITDYAVNEGLILLDDASRSISAAAGYTEIDSGVYNKKTAGSLIKVSWNIASGKTSTGANFVIHLRLKRNGVIVPNGEFFFWAVPAFIHSTNGALIVTGVPTGNSTWALDERVFTGGSTPVVNCVCNSSQIHIEEIKK
jgi:hypothetical protein